MVNKYITAPRLESGHFEWLYNQTGLEAFKIFSILDEQDQFGGIVVFNSEIKYMLDKLTELPIWLNGEIYKIPVKPHMLYWELTDDDEIARELDLELETLYASTHILHEVMNVNVSSMYVFSSIDEKQFKKSLSILTEKIMRLESSILQMAAKLSQDKYIIKAIRGRHSTLNSNIRYIVTPASVTFECLSIPSVIKSMIVVTEDRVYCYNDKSVENILERFSIEKRPIVKVNFEQMKKLIENYNTEFDSLLGNVFRHPITGYVGLVSIVPSHDINTIGIPADLSALLDGDDDGDIIDVVPLILVKRNKIDMIKTLID